MKRLSILVAILIAQASFAQTKANISGSDTLAGVMTDAIIAAGMTNKVNYVGGGSGVGEKALQNGEIGMTAMSRQVKPEVLTAIQAQGSTVIEHVIALDGIGLFVNSANSTTQLDLGTAAKIFACEITAWNQVPGSTKSGAIKAYRRNDQSGTTDTFKHLTGLKKFGACVTVVNETADIAEVTSKDVDAIGYAGLSAKTQNNQALAISTKLGGNYVAPLTATIRDASYPLSRSLYIYEISGQRRPSVVEQELLGYVLDRSFLDPIVQDHEFVTID